MRNSTRLRAGLATDSIHLAPSRRTFPREGLITTGRSRGAEQFETLLPLGLMSWGFVLILIALALPRTLRAQEQCTLAPLYDDTPPGRGAFSVDLRTRYFLIPSRVVPGLKLEPALAIRWSPTDRFALTFDAQTVDNSGPGRQGRYLASRTLRDPTVGSGNFFQEQALGARWRSANSCIGGSGIVLGANLSRGSRSYVLRDSASGSVAEGDNQAELVPTFDAGVEVRRDRWQSALGVAVAFFPADNALYLRRLPEARSDEFGTTAGLTLAGAVLITKIMLHARLFAPLTGANTIRRETGRTTRWTVYDVGLDYSVNPVLTTDIFVTNALGGSGALSLVADREYSALGARLRLTSGGDASESASTDPGDQVVRSLGTSLIDQSFARELRVLFGGGNG
ncbi:MAG: hypothetical protein ACREOG_07715, partial [Gemmatimonadaceae bacterium]